MNYNDYPRSIEMKGQRILGIDFGKKFTGLGMFHVGSDPYPLPFGRIAFKGEDDLIEQLKITVEEEFIDIIVLGIPFFTDGTESKLTKEIKQFFEKLKSSLPEKQIYWQDETLSTQEAKERMTNSPRYNFKVKIQEIDALCASIIIEDYIKNS